MTDTTKHISGAMRAALAIMGSTFPIDVQPTALAEIIDRETAASAMLEALKALIDLTPYALTKIDAEIRAKALAAIRLAEGGPR